MSEPYRIGIPIIDKVDLLDVCNAVEIFRWMNSFWKERTVEAPLIGKTKEKVKTGNGVLIQPDACFDDFDETNRLDALYVPGGGGDYVTAATSDLTPLPKEAAIVIAKRILGKLSIMSAMREMTVSMKPRR